MSSALKEKLIRLALACIAWSSLLFLGLIMFFLFMEGLPAFKYVSVKNFLFGMDWYPTAHPPEFEILPLIAGSLAVTVVSSCIAIPLGVLTAAWLTEVAPSSLRRLIKPIIELLAALPSVVVGFFGMVIVAPFLQNYLDADTGLN